METRQTLEVKLVSEAKNKYEWQCFFVLAMLFDHWRRKLLELKDETTYQESKFVPLVDNLPSDTPGARLHRWRPFGIKSLHPKATYPNIQIRACRKTGPNNGQSMGKSSFALKKKSHHFKNIFKKILVGCFSKSWYLKIFM
jgi:hypothetical protein